MTGQQISGKRRSSRRFTRYVVYAVAAVLALGSLQGCGKDAQMRRLSYQPPAATHIPGTTGSATGEQASLTPGQTYGMGAVKPGGDGVSVGVDRVHSVEGISIGDSEAALVNMWGKPMRIDQSEYGFPWYVYNKNKTYEHYFQAGVRDGRVVALYTNTKNWNGANGINDKSTISDIKRVYKSYAKSQDDEKAMNFSIAQTNVTFYFDMQDKQKILGVLLQDLGVGEMPRQTPNEEVRASFERQIFDLTNSARIKLNLVPYVWDDKAAATAQAHSRDMAANGYFDHKDKLGRSHFDRMLEAGIDYRFAGENISAGQLNAIEAYNNWMNSVKHRQNMLSSLERLGTGVALGGPMKIYYTQNFYTPMVSAQEKKGK